MAIDRIGYESSKDLGRDPRYEIISSEIFEDPRYKKNATKEEILREGYMGGLYAVLSWKK